jgi:lysozyme
LHKVRPDGLIEAYLDRKKGVWTIGWGSTYNPCTRERVQQGWVIDRDTADAWLYAYVTEAAQTIREAVRVPLTQGMFDALVSFVPNVGKGSVEEKTGFLGSTLLRVLNQCNYGLAADQFRRWIYDDGIKMGGLVIRRAKEEALFREGMQEWIRQEETGSTEGVLAT